MQRVEGLQFKSGGKNLKKYRKTAEVAVYLYYNITLIDFGLLITMVSQTVTGKGCPCP